MPEPTNRLDDNASADPATMLAILTEQQRRVDRALLAPVPWLYVIWGVSWLVGYFLLWSTWDGANPWFRVPVALAAPTFAVLIIGSIVSSAVIGSRINRGVRGISDFAGMVYGLSWSVCGFAFFALGAGLVFNG
ncbi:MAG: hypothetical protein LH605_07400, partial [Microbacteriaceae bacterium]|nr:hypothetical protein [Microbacteriaceae bacterium]